MRAVTFLFFVFLSNTLFASDDEYVVLFRGFHF